MWFTSLQCRGDGVGRVGRRVHRCGLGREVDDVVGPPHRPRVVCHDDHGVTGRRGGDGGEHDLGGVVVEAGGGLVEQEQVGTSYDGPGDREPLALTAGEQQARLPHHRVEPVGQPRANAETRALSAAERISSSVADGWPSAMLWRIVSSRNHDSWGT